MRLLDSRLYWWLNRLSSYLLLGGLWLFLSSPVITFFPATAALFAVFRAWQDNPDDAFYLPFFRRFREHFRSDLLLGLLWLLVPALLVANVALLPQLPPALRPPLFALLLLCGLLYAASSTFIFPLRASTTLGMLASARAAVVLGMTQLGTTALCLLAVAGAAAAFWLFPPSLLVGGVGAAHLIYGLCYRRIKDLAT